MTTLQMWTEVWTPLSVTTAVVSGGIFGIMIVGWIAINQLYGAPEPSALRIALLTFALATSAALIFYAGQTAATYLGHDPAWPRVASRYGLWVVFAAAIGAGTWARIRFRRSRRRSRAHERAVSELETKEKP